MSGSGLKKSGNLLPMQSRSMADFKSENNALLISKK